MKQRSKNFIIAIVSLMLLMPFLMIQTSCKKNPNNPNSGSKNMDNLVVDNEFNWSTTAIINVHISVEDNSRYESFSRISVFKSNPMQGGKLMSSGSISQGNPFNATLGLPNGTTEIFVRYESEFKLTETVEVAIVNGNAEYTFNSFKESGIVTSYLNNNDVGPDCDDCDRIVSGNESVTITGGETVCVTESFTGSVAFATWSGGGTLKVCGNAEISSLSMGTNSHLIITQDGTLVLSSINMWSNSASIMVYENATLTINNNFLTNGDFVTNQGTLNVTGNLIMQNLEAPEFTNSGTITVDGYVEINNGVTFNNSGVITSTGNYFHLNNGSNCINSGTILFNNPGHMMQINSGSSLTNDGSITVTGSLNINANSHVLSNCEIICTENMEINASDFVLNTGYLQGAQFIHITSNSVVSLNNLSMLSTAVLTQDGNGSIIGTGDMNSVKVTGTYTINSNNTVSGTVEAVTDDLVLSSGDINSHFINGATVVDFASITNNIPINGCNPEGIGSGGQIGEDTDLDGVPDTEDDYPNDPDLAYNNYFPAEDVYGTLAFEDMWPSVGDYDFNDDVVDYNFNLITNADNNLAKMNTIFILRAHGASYHNGFGFQLPFDKDIIENVSGDLFVDGGLVSLDSRNLENGQTKPVVIVWENDYDVLPHVSGIGVNTSPDVPFVTPDTLNITILFTSPVSLTGVPIPPYNPFIFVDGLRGVEIHLADNVPTDLANPDLFNTDADDSNPAIGRYYKTSTNLPWAINIIENFEYPIEKAEITNTYLKFGEWAESNGELYDDWWGNETGYRNNDNIYVPTN